MSIHKFVLNGKFKKQIHVEPMSSDDPSRGAMTIYDIEDEQMFGVLYPDGAREACPKVWFKQKELEAYQPKPKAILPKRAVLIKREVIQQQQEVGMLKRRPKHGDATAESEPRKRLKIQPRK